MAMTQAEILAKLNRNEITVEEAGALLEESQQKPMSVKVAEKSGGVSVYGLQQFPTTLYKNQWLRLLDFGDKIRAFIKENDAKLANKGSKNAA